MEELKVIADDAVGSDQMVFIQHVHTISGVPCWCNPEVIEMGPSQSWLKVEPEVDCMGHNSCRYMEPHIHGFACSKSCTTCWGWEISPEPKS